MAVIFLFCCLFYIRTLIVFLFVYYDDREIVLNYDVVIIPSISNFQPFKRTTPFGSLFVLPRCFTTRKSLGMPGWSNEEISTQRRSRGRDMSCTWCRVSGRLVKCCEIPTISMQSTSISFNFLCTGCTTRKIDANPKMCFDKEA